jgi:hypothetical protein
MCARAFSLLSPPPDQRKMGWKKLRGVLGMLARNFAMTLLFTVIGAQEKSNKKSAVLINGIRENIIAFHYCCRLMNANQINMHADCNS